MRKVQDEAKKQLPRPKQAATRKAADDAGRLRRKATRAADAAADDAKKAAEAKAGR
jgi:hypothetical protein